MNASVISNFNDSQNIQVNLLHFDEAPLISISQFAGSINFLFSMTPKQARECAAALIAMADLPQAVQA